MMNANEMNTTPTAPVAIHRFELAGLGKAPFRFAGFSVETYQACHGAPTQPGTSCDYCGTGIMNVCHVESADGKTFKVGIDCIQKVGDAGLIHPAKAAKKAHKRAKVDEARKLAREARERAEEEERTTKIGAFLAAHPGLTEAFEVEHKIIADIRGKFFRFGTMSDRQIAFVLRLAEEARTKAARPEPTFVPVTEGRRTVVGRILTTRAQDGYAYGSVEYKMLLAVEGPNGTAEKIWCTVPQFLFDAIREEERAHPGEIEGGAMTALRGRTVEITLTVERSRNDAAFGIGKRPTAKNGALKAKA